MSKPVIFHSKLIENPATVKGHGCISISFENVGNDTVFVDKAPIKAGGSRCYTCNRADGVINQAFIIDYAGQSMDLVVTREFYETDFNNIKELDV